jgi:hypothetical protein
MRWCRRCDVEAYIADSIGCSGSVLVAQGRYADLRDSAAGRQTSDDSCHQLRKVGRRWQLGLGLEVILVEGINRQAGRKPMLGAISSTY